MLAPEGDTKARGHPPSALVSSDAVVRCEAGTGGRVAELDCATRGVAAAASKATIVSFWMKRCMVFSRDDASRTVQVALPDSEAPRAGDSGESPRAVTTCGEMPSGAGDVDAGARRMFADDAQLLHAEPERVWMEAESFRRIARTVDAPSARTEDLLDMRTLDRG